MFVYQFMANIVETISGQEGEEFDPHKNRILEKPCSYGETMMHMLKGAIGAGILAMPDAVRRLGIVNSVFGIIGIGLFAIYCLQILIDAQYELCKRWKRGYIAYPKSMSLAIKSGPKWFCGTARFFYVMTDVMLVLWQLGLCAVYFVFVAITLQQVAEYNGMSYSVRMWILFLLPLQILCNLVKDLKLLTPISSFSNFIILIGLILVFFYLIEDDVYLDDEKMRLKGIEEIPIFVGMTLFALEAAGVILALEYNMERPERFVGICGLLTIGMLIILALFLVIGIAGYLKYGEEIKASITLNLPQHEKRAQAAKVTFGLALFFSYPLQNFVAYQILWRHIKKRVTMSAPLFWDFLLRILLVLIPYHQIDQCRRQLTDKLALLNKIEICPLFSIFTCLFKGLMFRRGYFYLSGDEGVRLIFAMAVAVPNLGGFIALLGALCLSLVAFVFPAIMDACIWYPDQFGFCRYKLIRDIFIIIFGMCALISGVYTSILEIVHSDI